MAQSLPSPLFFQGDYVEVSEKFLTNGEPPIRGTVDKELGIGIQIKVWTEMLHQYPASELRKIAYPIQVGDRVKLKAGVAGKAIPPYYPKPDTIGVVSKIGGTNEGPKVQIHWDGEPNQGVFGYPIDFLTILPAIPEKVPLKVGDRILAASVIGTSQKGVIVGIPISRGDNECYKVRMMGGAVYLFTRAQLCLEVDEENSASIAKEIKDIDLVGKTNALVAVDVLLGAMDTELSDVLQAERLNPQDERRLKAVERLIQFARQMTKGHKS